MDKWDTGSDFVSLHAPLRALSEVVIIFEKIKNPVLTAPVWWSEKSYFLLSF